VQDRAADDTELERVDELVGAWANIQLHENAVVQAVERGEPGMRRWYVRVAGEEKSVFTIWLTLRQRSLFFETYLLPAPVQNEAGFYQFLLRANSDLHGMAFSIGAEEAVFLAGHVPVDAVDGDELDRIMGGTYAYVERFFPMALRIGFGVAH
jgi:hypothetical protein